ncbi:MAG TPA: Hsp70 family protein [Longimicrobium sp.]|nr:Hsp70 family protein [Longimicrobium sp.]
MKAIGIDFGTSTSLVAVYEHGMPHPQPDPRSEDPRLPYTPSLVGVAPGEGGERLAVGWDAYPLLEHPQTVREVKLLLGDAGATRPTLFGEPYLPEEVAAVVLRHLCENAGRKLGEPVRDVVLSIPAAFGGAAREALLAAARIAGLNPLRLVNEPTAAALAYAQDRPGTDERVLVFDFGGGTLDVTLLEKAGPRLRVLATGGDRALGGRDFDAVLRELLRERLREAHPDGLDPDPGLDAVLRVQAERAKWSLSNQKTDDATYPVALGYVGMRSGAPVGLRTTLAQRDLAERAAPLLERARACLLRVLDEHHTPPEAVDTVLLVGGTTAVPAVARLLEAIFPGRCHAFNPLTAVAEGAATLAAQELGLVPQARRVEVCDVTGMGLGLRSEDGGTPWYRMLVRPNEPIPLERPRVLDLQLKAAAQAAFELVLYETSDTADAPYDPARHHELTRARSEGEIPASATGSPHRVRAELGYDDSAVITVAARVETGDELRMRKELTKTTQEIERSVGRVAALCGRNGHAAAPAAALPPAAPVPVPAEVSPCEELLERLYLLRAADHTRTVLVSDTLLRRRVDDLLTTARALCDNGTDAQKRALCLDLERMIAELEQLPAPAPA